MSSDELCSVYYASSHEHVIIVCESSAKPPACLVKISRLLPNNGRLTIYTQDSRHAVSYLDRMERAITLTSQVNLGETIRRVDAAIARDRPPSTIFTLDLSPGGSTYRRRGRVVARQRSRPYGRNGKDPLSGSPLRRTVEVKSLPELNADACADDERLNCPFVLATTSSSLTEHLPGPASDTGSKEELGVTPVPSCVPEP